MTLLDEPAAPGPDDPPPPDAAVEPDAPDAPDERLVGTRLEQDGI